MRGKSREFKSRASFIKQCYFQFAEIIGIEAGLIVTSFFLEFDFLIGQFIVIVIALLIYFSKSNKAITTITFDYENEYLELISFQYFHYKQKKIFFRDLRIILRMRFILNFYTKVIEFYNDDKLIAVLPLSNSLWEKEELEKLKEAFDALAEHKLHKDQYCNKLK